MTVLIFFVLVSASLFGDRLLFGDGAAMTLRNASLRSLFFVGAALLFALALWLVRGPTAMTLFLSGWATEKALSVDNLFAFVAVFAYFGIPLDQRVRVLRWGLLGAIVFRLLFVTIGAGALLLIGRPVELLFGLLVGFSSYKMLTAQSDGGSPVDHASRWYVRAVRRIIPFDVSDASGRFFVLRLRARPAATRLLLCLVAIEATDVAFSFDSVPAVIGIARDPVIIYSAMIFAILGLRAMYFVLDALRQYLAHLGRAVVATLAFIAGKLIVHAITGWDVAPLTSIAIIGIILATGVLASLPGTERATATDRSVP